MDKIPYIAYESALARLERTNRRLWIIVIILILALIFTNGLWFWYESQFEEITVTQESTADDDGIAIVNSGGDVNYGNGETND